MKKNPATLYFWVATLLFVVGIIAEFAAFRVGVFIFGIYAMLATLYGLELQKDSTNQSNYRKILLWALILWITVLLFTPLSH